MNLIATHSGKASQIDVKKQLEVATLTTGGTRSAIGYWRWVMGYGL